MQTLPNISRSTMKFGQLIEYKENFFLENHEENEAARLVPDLFFFFKKKALYELKASAL